MKQIATILGARPQFIKVAPVSKVIRQEFKELLINTGQHYDFNMSGVFFQQLNLPKPDYDLGVGSSTHGKQTGDALIQIEEVLQKEKPDAVIVYGDTNSTLAGALAASKMHIPLIHIEAGLRSYNKKMPEEINRVLTDHVSDLLFAPTKTAVENLMDEGIIRNVFNVGDIMYDSVKYYLKLSEEKYDLNTFNLVSKSYLLVTLHRAENTDDDTRLLAIINALISLNIKIVFPVHPRTLKRLIEIKKYDELFNSPHIHIIEPVSYLEMLLLEHHARAIITDSGGVQKEAYFARVPCFTLRTETEWVETVDAGWNTLIDPTKGSLDLEKYFNRDIDQRTYIEGIYGDGNAAKKILHYIKKYLN